MSRILVVGRHPEVMHRVLALIASAGHVAVGALTDDEAMASLKGEPPDALVLGGGVEPDSKQALAAAFSEARPGRPVIEHFGGPQGLLEHLQQRL